MDVLPAHAQTHILKAVVGGLVGIVHAALAGPRFALALVAADAREVLLLSSNTPPHKQRGGTRPPARGPQFKARSRAQGSRPAACVRRAAAPPADRPPTWQQAIPTFAWGPFSMPTALWYVSNMVSGSCSLLRTHFGWP